MTPEDDSNEFSSQMRNAMMVFVAKFLFIILPPLIGIFFYILTMTKNDVQITVGNEITKIEQTHQSNIAQTKALLDKIEQTHQSKIAEMGVLKDQIEQSHQSNIAKTGVLHDRIKQTHKNNITEMERLKAKIDACEKGCGMKNLELKISEKRTLSDRFKMNFNVDKKKVEFKFEEIKEK